MKANHQPTKFPFNKGDLSLNKGEFITGRAVASLEIAISPQQYRTAIKYLKSTSRITTKTTNKFTVITVNNWDSYQMEESSNQQTNQPITNEQPTTNQPATTYKNVKNEKNEKNDKEKNKRKNLSEIHERIFKHWNSKKQRGNLWKGHDELLPEIREAISGWIHKGYTPEHLEGAIDNYAKILLGKDYKWTYAWGLYHFLTRSRKENREEKQLFRFLPNNFHEEEFLSDSAKKGRLRNNRKPIEVKKISPVTEEEKKAIREKLSPEFQARLKAKEKNSGR